MGRCRDKVVKVQGEALLKNRQGSIGKRMISLEKFQLRRMKNIWILTFACPMCSITRKGLKYHMFNFSFFLNVVGPQWKLSFFKNFHKRWCYRDISFHKRPIISIIVSNSNQWSSSTSWCWIKISYSLHNTIIIY